jgi:hypothetical protein
MRGTGRLLAAILIIVCSRHAAAHVEGPVAGCGARYWWCHSLIYAEVKSVRAAAQRETIINVRPLGTLSGRFDSGGTQEISVDVFRSGEFAIEPSKERVPAAGEKILLVLEQSRFGEGEYAIAHAMTAYMPGQHPDPLRIVGGSSDPEVSATLTTVQELRKQDDTVDPRATWRAFAALAHPRLVVCATVVDIGHGAEASASNRASQTFVFRPLRVLFRPPPPTDDGYIWASFLPPDGAKRFRSKFKTPPLHSTVIVAVSRMDAQNGRYCIAPGPLDFMPGDHSPICEIKGLDDPSVAETAKILAAAQYWETHSLVCANIVGTAEVAGRSPMVTFDLRPKLTLSGAFDVGKTVQVSPSIALRHLGPNFKSYLIGPKAIVLLVRTGDSYSISPEQPAFMPGDHSPICAVKDFDDPKVKQTLDAVQKLRHASDDVNPKSPPAKR